MRATGWRVVRFRNVWNVVWYDDTGARRRHSLGKEVLTKRDAYLAAPSVVNQYGKTVAAVRSVGQIVEDYLKRSEAITIETLKFHWKYAKPTFGNILPAQITEDLCKAYFKKRGVKAGTILKELGLIRAALRRAKVTDGSFWMPQQPPPRDRRLTREDVAALIAECKQPHLLLFVLVARYTAARMSAILSLKWDAIDFEKRLIDLGGHGRQKRRAVIPMAPELAFALVVAREVATSPYVIEYAGDSVASVKTGFKAACKRAGIKDASPHIMRHTAASWMAERGVDMALIAQFLGHTNQAVTFRVYARYSPNYLKDALAALSDSPSRERVPVR